MFPFDLEDELFVEFDFRIGSGDDNEEVDILSLAEKKSISIFKHIKKGTWEKKTGRT